MAVLIKLSPLLWKYVQGYDQKKGLLLENVSGRNLSQIIRQLSIPHEKVTSILVNHLPSKSSHIAKDGDLIFLGFVMGGG